MTTGSFFFCPTPCMTTVETARPPPLQRLGHVSFSPTQENCWSTQAVLVQCIACMCRSIDLHRLYRQAMSPVHYRRGECTFTSTDTGHRCSPPPSSRRGAGSYLCKPPAISAGTAAEQWLGRSAGPDWVRSGPMDDATGDSVLAGATRLAFVA